MTHYFGCLWLDTASFEVGQIHLMTGSIEVSSQLPAVEGLQNIWDSGISCARLVVNLISFLGGDIGCIISRSHFGTIMVRSCQWGQKQVEAEPTQGQQHHETHRLKLPFSNLKACTASMPCHARELFNVMSWLLGRGSESSRVTDPKCVCTVPINPSVSWVTWLCQTKFSCRLLYFWIPSLD